MCTAVGASLACMCTAVGASLAWLCTALGAGALGGRGGGAGLDRRMGSRQGWTQTPLMSPPLAVFPATPSPACLSPSCTQPTGHGSVEANQRGGYNVKLLPLVRGRGRERQAAWRSEGSLGGMATMRAAPSAPSFLHSPK